jgi:hypothetical protein
MRKHFFVLFLAACSLWVAVITSLVTACSSDSGGNEGQRDGTVKLVLGKLQVPLFDSISVHVSAEDMKSIYVSAKNMNADIKIDGIPFGENRKFEVKVYADRGKEVLKGEAVTVIIAGQTTTIPISLTALSGFLKLEIPLGLPNSTGIHSGTLLLISKDKDSLSFQMQPENGKGVFNTGALPLNQVFDLELKLKDSNGDVIFFGEKQIKLSSISQTETIPLQSNKGTAILELEASHDRPMQILAVLPMSISRKPENYGDLFFTEIFADPKSTGGEYYQYMEIYNATLDTLELSGCRIAINNKNTTTIGQNRMDLPEDLILLPMEFLYLGRESITDADFNYEKFRITKDGQNIGFFCGNSIIDTLAFFKIGDNRFPLEMGTPMQLPLSNYENRTEGSFWCLGSSPKQDALCK